MSVLIEIRKRIKAIETIKKITHAMQLISMSTHAKLRTRDQFSHDYQQQLAILYQKVKAHVPNWHNDIFLPRQTQEKNLIILVGSQKGLVGNFNTTLVSLFTKNFFTAINPSNTDIVLVGRKVVEHSANILKEKNISQLHEYPEFGMKNLQHLAHALMHIIQNQKIPYTSVLVYSNQQKTFFIQKVSVTRIIPFPEESSTPFIDYYWEQQPTELLNAIAHQYLYAHIEHLLFQSLLAEHAARFISMDNATRNAKQLKDETTLQYNKLRQFKITKELTEISSGFQD